MTRFTVKQTVLGAAIVAGFGMAVAPAFAAVGNGVNLNTGAGVAKIANEIPSNTAALANTGGALSITLASPTGVIPTNTDPVYIRVNLSGNAKFSAAPSLECTVISGTDSGSSNLATAIIQAGGNGFNYVTFNLNSADAAGITAGASASWLSGNCTVSGMTGVNIASGGLVSYSVTARTEYKDGASYTTAYLSDKSYITFTKGVDGVASAASGLVVDATSGSDNFASAQSDLLSQTLARLGKYVVTAIGTSAASATLGGNISGQDVFSGVTVTVSGAALVAGLAANTSAGVFLSTSAACTDSTGVFSSTANAGTTVTFTGLTTATLAGTTGVFVCMNVSGGTTQIATGAVYVGSTGTFAANVTTNLSGMESLITISSNGTTKNAYIVHSPSSTAKATQLWVKNTGATAGAVYVTCYNSAGTAVGTSNSTLISSLAVNELAKKTSSDVFTAINYTGYTATEKFSCVLNGALAGMELVNQTQDTGTGAVTVTQSQTN